MDKLDVLLSIVDRKERQEALRDFAKSLKVNDAQAVDAQGRLNEEKLVLLVFDAQRARVTSRSSNNRFAVMGAVVTIVISLGMIFLPKWLARMYEKAEMQNQSQDKVMQGFDKDGNPVVENGQPVLYKMMDGTFYDYHDNGRIKFEFTYSNGQLLQRKTYDETGKLVDVQKSDEE